MSYLRKITEEEINRKLSDNLSKGSKPKINNIYDYLNIKYRRFSNI